MDIPSGQRSEKPKQLRGAMLEEYLVCQLQLWWASVVDSGLPFVYSQLEFSRKVGVSRETIRKKQYILDVVLAGGSVKRRVLDGTKRRQEDVIEIKRLESELHMLRSKYKCLQTLHVNIFSKLLTQGVDMRDFGLHCFDD
jgi:hypothetical protein